MDQEQILCLRSPTTELKQLTKIRFLIEEYINSCNIHNKNGKITLSECKGAYSLSRIKKAAQAITLIDELIKDHAPGMQYVVDFLDGKRIEDLW